MKRKPDAMMTVLGLFVVGLLISGFSSMSIGADEQAPKDQGAFERSVSRY